MKICITECTLSITSLAQRLTCSTADIEEKPDQLVLKNIQEHKARQLEEILCELQLAGGLRWCYVTG